MNSFPKTGQSEVAPDAAVVERAPSAESRLKLRRDGPYFIAPDSAEPLPDAIWDRIDLEALEEAAQEANDLEHAASAEERAELTAMSGFYIPREDRELLRRIGGPTMVEVLRSLGEDDPIPLDDAPSPK